MAKTKNVRQYLGVQPINPPETQRAARAPTTADTAFRFNTIWIDTAANDVYQLTNVTSGSAYWTLLGSSSSVITDVPHGGTGVATITNHGVILGQGTSAVVALAAASTGTLLAGVTGLDPAFTSSPSVTGAITAGTSLTATSGAITATNGNLVLGTAGNKILSTSVATTTAGGANSFGSVTLVGGTATVSTTAVTSNSLIYISRLTVGATGAAALGIISVGTITNATSFVINSLVTANATSLATTDVSNICWMIVN